MISLRAKNIAPSATLQLNDKVKAMKKQGIDVIDFGIGEPDFDTPENIKQAAIRALSGGFTKYTNPAGIIELRDAIARKLKNENNLDYNASQIVVSAGAKHSLTNIFFALLNKDDEVIIPSPYWTSYPENVKLAEGIPVFVKTKNFQLDAEKIEDAVTSRTKIIVLNSPSNPTGAVFTEEELESVAEIALENDIYVISDEIYEKFVYNGRHASIASMEGMKDFTIVVNGFSKTYAMTGWRLGYAAGPEDIMKAVVNIQSQMTGPMNSISQMAALEALKSGVQQDMVSEFDRRRKYVMQRLAEISGIKLKEPEGAFYAFPDISSFGISSAEFSSQLLEKARVSVVPGKDFGDDEHIRISYATSMKTLEEGMNRLENFVKKL